MLSVLLAGMLLLLSGCTLPKSVTPISRTGLYFDTVITVTVYEKEDAAAIDDCFALAERYENLFSDTIETSDVSRINAAGGDAVTVDPDTIELLTIALDYAERSNGAFDPTIGALSSLWDFTAEDPHVPEETEIAAALATVDYHAVALNAETCTVRLTNPAARLDLGGIAKGYIADRMKEQLLSDGVTSAIINLGGNVLTVGEKPDGDAYTVGIQYPFEPEGTPIATLPVKDASLVSSGVYERYFTEGNVRYHHLLDTKTGYPVRNSLLGVTILSDASVDGDALSTICFCLGLEDGLSLIESLDGIEAVFITEDEVLHSTAGLTDLLQLRLLDNAGLL